MIRITDEEKREYLRTAIITLICLVVIIGIVVAKVANTTHERINKTFSSKFVFEAERIELDRLYYQEKLYPDDFMINLKIAMLHEKFNEPKLAGMNYEKTLLKAPKNPFVLYRAALFYLSQKDYPAGVYLIETLPDKPDLQTLSIKMGFYTALSDSMTEDGDIPDAVTAAKLALKYARVISKEKYKAAKRNMAEKYSLCADFWVERGDDEQAVVMLKNSLEMEDSPQTKYKLALVHMEKRPRLAAKLMDEIFNSKDAKIVNVEIYYKLITRLYEMALEQDEPTLADFYAFKEQALKKFIIKNYLFQDELKVYNINRTKKGVSFNIKNISKNDINSLYLKIDINGKTFLKRAASPLEPLGAGEVREDISFSLRKNLLNRNGVARGFRQVNVYGRKNKNFDWILIYKGVIGF